MYNIRRRKRYNARVMTPLPNRINNDVNEVNAIFR